MKVTGQIMIRSGTYYIILYKIENCLWRASASNGTESLQSHLFVTKQEAYDEIRELIRENCSKVQNGTN